MGRARTYVSVKLNENLDYDTWFRSEYPRVLAAVAVASGRSLSLVEDATTDAFVKAFERWESVSEMRSPTGWVTRVAINKARRSSRRILRLAELLDTNRVDPVLSDNYADAELVDALAALTCRQRTAIVLHHVEGFTQAEIASDLDIAPGTASATLAQARKKLRTQLREARGHAK